MKKIVSVVMIFQLLVTPVLAPQAFFSPRGGIRNKIISEIRNERNYIHAALYFLTDKELSHELAKAARRGVAVEIICDVSSTDGDWSKVDFLSQENIPIYIYNGGKKSIMHHKFWVFGGTAVITGSFNATRRAEEDNYENIVVLDDPAIVRQFDTEFSRVKGKSKRWNPENSSWHAWTNGLTAWAH